MKKTLQDQYLLIKEGKGHKGVFIKEAKRQFPGLIRNSATYTEVANVLKTKNLINENVIGLEPINQLEPSKKESYEVAFENFLAEAKKKKEEDEKAELKKPSKQVEEDAEKNFDYEDKKNPDNLIFDQMMKGYYTEMKNPKNEDKTMEQLKAIVIKNLEKNPIYYTEKGQFGVKDLGYTMDAPGLGEPKEPKGKFKSSGYGDLNENKEPINEEDQIRKVVRSIINEELEDEFYQKQQDLDNMTFDQEKEAHRQAQEYSTEGITQHVNYDGIGYFVSDEFSEDTIATYENGKMINADALKEVVDSEKDERYFIKSKKRKSTSHLPGFHKPALGEEELEEGYDDGEMGTYQRSDVFEDKDDDGFDEVWEKFKKDLRKRMGQPESPKNESLKESDDFNSRLDDVINNQYDGDPKVKEAATDWNALQNVKMGSGREAYAPMLNRYWQDYGRETGNTGVMAAEEAGGFGFTTMYESKIRKVIRESIEKELAQINKEAEYEVLDSKLEKITDLIDRRKSRLSKLDEDEDIKALTDKKKVKQFEKEIKTLEKAKLKIEKVLAKKAKSTPKKKEVIDEDEPLDEAELNEAPPSQDLEKGKELTADMLKDLQDMEKIELEENDEEIISGCCSAPISGELDGKYGRCSDCGEMADVIKL